MTGEVGMWVANRVSISWSVGVGCGKVKEGEMVVTLVETVGTWVGPNQVSLFGYMSA